MLVPLKFYEYFEFNFKIMPCLCSTNLSSYPWWVYYQESEISSHRLTPMKSKPYSMPHWRCFSRWSIVHSSVISKSQTKIRSGKFKQTISLGLFVLLTIVQEDRHRCEERELGSWKYTSHVFDFETEQGASFLIGGLTASILIRTASLVYQRAPDFSDQHLPDFQRLQKILNAAAATWSIGFAVGIFCMDTQFVQVKSIVYNYGISMYVMWTWS